MTLDEIRGDLRQEIENLETQRQQAANLFQQATGALALARAMLEKLEGVSLTVAEFAEMVGGKNAQATLGEV